MRAPIATLLVLFTAVWSASTPGSADEEAKSDATQRFDSPLPLGGGATLQVARTKKKLTVGFSRQLEDSLVNYLSVGLSGVPDDDGRVAAVDGSDLAPGIEGKLGLGYSSFVRTDFTNYTAAGARLEAEAWCVDLTKAVNKKLKQRVAIPKDPATCKSAFDLVERASVAHPPDGDAAKQVATAVAALKSRAAGPWTPILKFEACKELKDVPWSGCASTAEQPIPTIESRRRQYPTIARGHFEGVPAYGPFHRLSVNWMPSMRSIGFRPMDEGTPQLSDQQTWTKLLQGVSAEYHLHGGRFQAGVQLGFRRDLDPSRVKPVEICNSVSQGTLGYRTCAQAVLGEPAPEDVLSIGGALLLDPLVPPTTFARIGAQALLKMEDWEAAGRKTTLAVPVYLSPAKAPMGLVAGFQPQYRWSDGDDRGFSLSVFVSARP